MTPTPSRTARITTLVVAAAVAVVLGVVAFGLSRNGSSGIADVAATQSPAPVASAAATGAPTAAVPTAPTTPTSAAPTPQATATAPLQSAAPITSTLTARIVSMRAVQAKATQPGQVGGPALRFVIRLANAGAKPVDLSSAVVNVYSGVDQEPAYQLDSDGLVFPSSVAARSSVTGTALFTVPVSDRGQVRITVDTSATTTVVAFSGAAPK